MFYLADILTLYFIGLYYTVRRVPYIVPGFVRGAVVISCRWNIGSIFQQNMGTKCPQIDILNVIIDNILYRIQCDITFRCK